MLDAADVKFLEHIASQTLWDIRFSDNRLEVVMCPVECQHHLVRLVSKAAESVLRDYMEPILKEIGLHHTYEYADNTALYKAKADIQNRLRDAEERGEESMQQAFRRHLGLAWRPLSRDTQIAGQTYIRVGEVED